MKLITTKEAAEMLYTTEYTVRKYIRNGRLTASRIGKQYLIDPNDIEKLLQEYRTNNA